MNPARILYLEDNPADALLIGQLLEHNGLTVRLQIVDTADRYRAALEHGEFDLILSDSNIGGFTSLMALQESRQRHPDVPFICVSGTGTPETFAAAMAAGANAYVLKDRPEQVAAAVGHAIAALRQRREIARLEGLNRGMLRLVSAVQELSHARTVEAIRDIVRHAARQMTGADGATFVLRDGDHCHYVDEDAISPLWKGQRFPMSTCISGWAMLHGQPAIIEDIYTDPRIPTDAYRPTFVKSLVMVPIRPGAALGAIGNYWAGRHLASEEEVQLLQALANTTAVAMENVQVYAELEQRVRERTAQFEAANRELEAFSYSVSHDLRAPLRAINGFARLLEIDYGEPHSEKGRRHLQHIIESGARMGALIEDLLRLARITRSEIRREPVDLGALAQELAATLRTTHPGREVVFTAAPRLLTQGDPGLLRAALENLLSNAWKYTARTPPPARIELGGVPQADGTTIFFVRDNGTGFDMQHASRLFSPFQRLHSESEYPGTGVGLATVQRIIHKHGGRIWAEAEPGRGASFCFTLPAPDPVWSPT